VSEPNDFARRMTLRGIRVEANSDAAVRKFALLADQAVVNATPVDTGRARSNWIVNFDSPSAVVREALAEGPAAGSAAIAEAAAKIAVYNGDVNREIHLTNNLPYIGRLNDGYSAQAPAGFVEQAVQIAAAAVAGTRLLD